MHNILKMIKKNIFWSTLHDVKPSFVISLIIIIMW